MLAFTAGVAVVSVFLFGLVPGGARRALTSCHRSRRVQVAWFRDRILDRGIITVQVALALVLVRRGRLFVASLRNLRTSILASRRPHLVSAWLDTRGTPYEAGGIIPLQAEIIARVERIRACVMSAMGAMLACSADGRASTEKSK